jgi:hypothetical protein
MHGDQEDVVVRPRREQVAAQERSALQGERPAVGAHDRGVELIGGPARGVHRREMRLEDGMNRLQELAVRGRGKRRAQAGMAQRQHLERALERGGVHLGAEAERERRVVRRPLRILLVEQPERLLAGSEREEARRALARFCQEVGEELPLLLGRERGQVGA